MDPGGRTLAELVRQAAEGNRDAADELVRRVVPHLRAVVHGRLKPGLRARLDTEDIVQTTLFVALQDLSHLEYRDDRAFLAWLSRIAERKIQMATRRHLAARRDVRRERGRTGVSSAGALSQSVSDVVGVKEERRQVREVVNSLGRVDRKIVEMRGYHGLPYKEISVALGLPTADAARLRFLRALTRIRAAIRREV